MEIRIEYTTNEQGWALEKIAADNGYTKTQDCYWTQILENANGDSIVTTLEKTVSGDPVAELNDRLAPAAEEEQDTTADILRKAADIIEARKDRSAWDKGVNAYALELLDNLADLAPNDLSDRAIIRAALLNGARDWQQYSYGGCALIYDCDIAERLCTPSELKRCRGGEWNLSSKENWLDVQARALRRAGFRVEAAIKEVRA